MSYMMIVLRQWWVHSNSIYLITWMTSTDYLAIKWNRVLFHDTVFQHPHRNWNK